MILGVNMGVLVLGFLFVCFYPVFSFLTSLIMRFNVDVALFSFLSLAFLLCVYDRDGIGFKVVDIFRFIQQYHLHISSPQPHLAPLSAWLVSNHFCQLFPQAFEQ